MIIHFCGFFWPFLAPPWGLEFLDYCHIKLTPSIHPWTVGPAQKWTLMNDSCQIFRFFPYFSHFWSFWASGGAFGGVVLLVGAPRTPVRWSTSITTLPHVWLYKFYGKKHKLFTWVTLIGANLAFLVIFGPSKAPQAPPMGYNIEF